MQSAAAVAAVVLSRDPASSAEEVDEADGTTRQLLLRWAGCGKEGGEGHACCPFPSLQAHISSPPPLIPAPTPISPSSSPPPRQAFSRFGALLQVRGSNSVVLQRLSREGLLWAPCVGNICTLVAFLMALALNYYVSGEGGCRMGWECGGAGRGGPLPFACLHVEGGSTLLPPPSPSLLPPGGSPEAIFMLAPLLLLLSQDPLLLPDLEDRQRYFPPALAVTGYLVTAAVVQVCLPTHTQSYTSRFWPLNFSSMQALEAPVGASLLPPPPPSHAHTHVILPPPPAVRQASSVGDAGWPVAAKGVLLVAMTLPSHAMFLAWLWTQVGVWVGGGGGVGRALVRQVVPPPLRGLSRQSAQNIMVILPPPGRRGPPCHPPSSCPLPQKPQPGVAVVLGAAALNVLPLLLAAGGALLPRYLGLLGLAMALVQYFAMKHVRGIGAKII